MSRTGIFEAAGQCGNSATYSVRGMFLRGHAFKTCKIGWHEGCYFKCAEEITCQSYNVVIGQNVCELNNRTKEARPEDFLPDRRRYYVGMQGNRVPLGSIELPAQSCSEIKASEGNEMVKGDYWIYADGNGQAILARCEENWQKINTEPVCFGARDNQYGAFNITKSGRLKTMKLIRKSGSIKCNPVYNASYWGCNYPLYGKTLTTIVTNTNNELVLPPVEDLKAFQQGEHAECGPNQKHFYSLNGTYRTSLELVFRDLTNQLTVTRNQELQIWCGQDWVDCSETGNSGKTCVDVYAWAQTA
ncbi:hypothetical protein ACROYT_G024771 [Oculina patagonica]